MACKCKHIDIMFEVNEQGGPGRFVGVENEKGCNPGVGEWEMRGDGFWAYRITEDEWPTQDELHPRESSSKGQLTHKNSNRASKPLLRSSDEMISSGPQNPAEQ